MLVSRIKIPIDLFNQNVAWCSRRVWLYCKAYPSGNLSKYRKNPTSFTDVFRHLNPILEFIWG